MTAVGELARLGQMGTALATAGHSLGVATKKKKKNGLKGIMSAGVGTIVGTSFVRAQGSLISGL